MALPADEDARVLDEAIDPFYDQVSLQNSFGSHGDEIDRHVESRAILCLLSSDGHSLANSGGESNTLNSVGCFEWEDRCRRWRSG